MILRIINYTDVPLGGLIDDSPALRFTSLICLFILLGALTGIVAFIRQMLKSRNMEAKLALLAVQVQQEQAINGSIGGPFEKAWNRFLLTSGILSNVFFIAFSIQMIQSGVGGNGGVGDLFVLGALIYILFGGVCGIIIPIHSEKKQFRWENSIQTTPGETSSEKVKWLLVRQFFQKICLCPVFFSIIVFRDYFYFERILGKTPLFQLLCIQIILSVSGFIAVVRLVKFRRISLLRAVVSIILFLFPILDLISLRLLYCKTGTAKSNRKVVHL